MPLARPPMWFIRSKFDKEAPINMKLRIFSFTLIALLAAAAGSERDSLANGKVDEILANMQKAAANVTTIQAKMDQTKRNMQIGGTERYRGEVFFKHVAKGN